jgi:hypothetical protein
MRHLQVCEMEARLPFSKGKPNMPRQIPNRDRNLQHYHHYHDAATGTLLNNNVFAQGSSGLVGSPCIAGHSDSVGVRDCSSSLAHFTAVSLLTARKSESTVLVGIHRGGSTCRHRRVAAAVLLANSSSLRIIDSIQPLRPCTRTATFGATEA